MKRKYIYLLCVVLILSLATGGCTMFRRPAPERAPVPTPAPQPENPAPRTQPVPGQTGPDGVDMANRIADLATNVEGVDSAAVVVVSNLALVGVTIEEGAAENQSEIKQKVIRQIEDNESGIVNTYVSANPDIVKQLREIAAGVQRGEPISTFFDQLTDIVERMRAETSQDTQNAPQ